MGMKGMKSGGNQDKLNNKMVHLHENILLIIIITLNVNSLVLQ